MILRANVLRDGNRVDCGMPAGSHLIEAFNATFAWRVRPNPPDDEGGRIVLNDGRLLELAGPHPPSRLLPKPFHGTRSRTTGRPIADVRRDLHETSRSPGGLSGHGSIGWKCSSGVQDEKPSVLSRKIGLSRLRSAFSTGARLVSGCCWSC
jgi:hypothetical protein